jgi:hypothetical protein
MKMTTRWNRFASCTLFRSLTWMLCLLSIDSGWAQDKTGGAAGADAQAEDYLDLRGDVPNPRRIDTSELKKLPRLEMRTTDPHDPGKEIIYSGTPLVEVLKAGGLRLDSDTARIRETVAITVLIVGPKLFIEPGTKAIYPAFERERPRIVNNFAVERVARLRIAVLFREMNSTRPSNLAMRLE